MKNKLTIYAISLIVVVGCVIGGFAMASYFDVIGLRNAAGTQINPATEDKQDDIISGLVSVSSTAPLVVLANPNGTYPVSGTFWQATQPVSGTFWQATQPISAASLPLPTGASTAALQSTLNGYVDGLEGYFDGVEGVLGTIDADTGNIATSAGVMDDWDDADRAKISNRLVVDFYSSSTVGTTAVLVFDASAHTDTVYYRVTNNDTAEVYVAPYAFLTTTDFMSYIPPYQGDVFYGAGNTGTVDDLYAIHDTGDSGSVLVVGYKYK